MIVLDGPMGTELAARGVATPPSSWSAEAITTAPDVVRAIHAEYAENGAEVHRANTFRVQKRIFGEALEETAAQAVILAREGILRTRRAGRVAGSVAPVRDCYRPDLSPAALVARAEHRANVAALARAGVDLVICETFPHPVEACIAVEEATRAGLETWLALTAGPEGELMSPESMERAARDGAAAGASAVLVNCTAAERTLAYVERLARIGLPFGAYGNAFGAQSVTPERYAELARAWLAAGATLVGACCGAGPAHVAALAALS
jgi:S-methylmethionine-dependent homocysteine/selenocysteine methylase